MDTDVSVLLYSVIDEMGRKKVREKSSSDIGLATKYCEEISRRVMTKLGSPDEETLAAVCEALLHFMLTASLLPSQRKLRLGAIDLDIVIPSAKMLLTEPKRAVVIQVIRRPNELGKLLSAEQVQPVRPNIWLVSASKLATPYRNYSLEDHSYSKILADIHTFIVSKRISGLKLLQGE